MAKKAKVTAQKAVARKPVNVTRFTKKQLAAAKRKPAADVVTRKAVTHTLTVTVESGLSAAELKRRMTTCLVDKRYTDFGFIIRGVK